MKKKVNFIWMVVIVFLIGFVISLTINMNNTAGGDGAFICYSSNNFCWDLEIVDTPEERAQGLMFRESLDPNIGMWFIFEEEGVYPFWMKDTLIPLDIIWINSDFEVVYIANAVPCVTEKCEIYDPDAFALYVLELNAGEAKRVGLEVGSGLGLGFKD